jgi:hypothetical protein
MTRWKTDDVVDVLKKALPKATVETDMAGGDVDTDTIIIRLPNNDGGMFVCGFITNGYFDENRSDVDVEMVELNAGDSGGGLSGVTDPEIIRAYSEAMIALQGMGFQVVPCLKDFF